MNSRYGRVYKPRGLFRRMLKALAVTALVLIVLFFYCYFTWQKYIVYDGENLYLDLPFMDGEGRPASTGGNGGQDAAKPVSDSLTGDAAQAGGDADGSDAGGQNGDDAGGDTAGQGGETEPGSDTQPDTGDGVQGDDSTAQPDAPDQTQPEPDVPQPGDDAAEPEEDTKPDNGVKDSFT